LENFLPKSTDVIFKDEVKQDYGAWLKNPANIFFLNSEGYKKAGEMLWTFCNENKFYSNTLIYPLVFTYRQFLELRLKELIIVGCRYINVEKEFADVHSLLKLWLTYRIEILNSIKNIDGKILYKVEKIIAQFNTEDPKSMCFRYPVTRAPKRKDSINRETIDLLNFKEVIDKLIYFFDWQWATISHYEDLKSEMIAEMYRDYWNLRKTHHNSVYVAIPDEVVNRRSVLLRNFVLNGQASDSNPLLHIHAKR
jgi:hypothetical protein